MRGVGTGTGGGKQIGEGSKFGGGGKTGDTGCVVSAIFLEVGFERGVTGQFSAVWEVRSQRLVALVWEYCHQIFASNKYHQTMVTCGTSLSSLSLSSIPSRRANPVDTILLTHTSALLLPAFLSNY